MEPYRERIEEFIRRYGRVLAVAIGVLLALLALRALRRISVVVVPALVGVVLAAWLVLGPLSAPEDTQTSVERKVVRACGREFVIPTPLAEDRSFVRGMRLDCGILGPQAEGERNESPYDGPY